MKLVGFQNIDYEKKDGTRVTGVKLHITYEDENVDGEAADQIYVGSAVKIPVLKIGDEIDIRYNRFGRIDSVSLLYTAD